jgi:oligopeptide transport system permease protein
MSEPTAVGAAVQAGLNDPNAKDHFTERERDTKGATRARSLGRDAWDDLRRRPIFWIALVLMVTFIVMAIAPWLFTSKDPELCRGELSATPPSSEAWFGYDAQGCDIYARTVYGARASIAVGFVATTFALLLGAGLGILAGFYGGKTDTVISRVTDIFFAIPILLGSIIVLSSFPSSENTPQAAAISKVAFAIAILGWTATARLARSSVIQVKQADYVLAARSLGASNSRIIRRHIIPNSLAPVIVITTISLGAYIGAEATLSYLGIGLQPPVISWGIAINEAQDYIRTDPWMMAFPAVFLSLTVLSFIMLGDTIREALDPKLR